MIDISSACPALLVAVHDALHIEPCRGKFSCLREKRRLKNIRQFIRECWQLVPDAVRDPIHGRLQLYLFASANYQSMPWSQFLYYFDESTMFGVTIREHYDDWRNDRRQVHPSTMLYRILLQKQALSLEAATYIVELLNWQVRHQIAQVLLTELHRACHAVTFVSDSSRSRSQLLQVQFVPDKPSERRPLQLNFGV